MNWVTGLLSNWFRPRQVGGTWFYPINNDSWKDVDCLKNFEDIPELNAIINLKARSFSVGEIYPLDTTTGERLPDDEVTKLIANPNWFQGEKEFLRQTKLFHEIFGNEYLYAWFGIGAKPLSTKAMYTLPPNLVECEYIQGKTPFFMNSVRPESGITYKYIADNEKTNLALEQIIHLNDNRVNVTDKTFKDILKGQSKQVALRPAINNLRMAYETRGVILKRRGALGILSNAGADVSGQIPLFKKERDSIQKQYSQYGGLESQDNLIITNANLKWQQMTVSPDKLGLFTETREDFLKLCDGYGVPPELFGSDKGTTYENQNEARKGFYDNTIVPEANEWIGAINKFFYGNDPKVKQVINYSGLAIYQEDMKLRGESLDALITALSKALADKAITLDAYQKELAKMGIAIGVTA